MTGLMAWVTGEAPPTELTASEINSSYTIVIIIVASACACLLIATPILYATLKSKKKIHRSGKYLFIWIFFFFISTTTQGLDKSHSQQDLLEKSDFPMNYIYTVAATSIIFFIINLFIMLWYIVRKRNKARKFWKLKPVYFIYFFYINYTCLQSLCRDSIEIAFLRLFIYAHEQFYKNLPADISKSKKKSFHN